MIPALLAAIYTTFTVPTHNQGVLAMPEFIQTRTCDPFLKDCTLDASWTAPDTSPIGPTPNCLPGPHVPAGSICCFWPARPNREEMLFCAPLAYNKNLLFDRSVCRTCGDGVVRCGGRAHEPILMCTPRPGGGCPCNMIPSQGTCVYP